MQTFDKETLLKTLIARFKHLEEEDNATALKEYEKIVSFYEKIKK